MSWGADSIAIEDILAGNLRAIARAATAIENRNATELLRSLFPHTGRALVAGITGAPGAGKSTLADRMAALFRSEGKKVGIIAVDPTSPFSGGAILGDRIRMQDHHADPGVFIRSMATRGQLGGLAPTTGDLALLLDAAGYDVVLIETVGVGQDEVEIARLADVTCVVLVPGMGDDVQAIKAGIMEIADVYLLNKADLPGVEKLEREVQFVLTLATRSDGWTAPVVRCVGTDDHGIGEAVAAIRAVPRSSKRTAENWAARLRALYRERMVALLDTSVVEAAAAEVAERRRDPYSIVEGWLKGDG